MNNVISEKELISYGVKHPILHRLFTLEYDSSEFPDGPEVRLSHVHSPWPQSEVDGLGKLITELNKPLKMWVDEAGDIHIKVKNSLTN